ncbi:outer membrane transport energization protein TonB [Zunongwangia mangrovi]|uniref:Outer membrane transport energization protein TonB n=1 Tax=Zunongwangia mangrovi TaxID=1334022 RepID=A0A1I1KSE3_9FLAO|nr:energy transducer TonB [Zunongwangia mangrovi]SFC63729.1 outer membrane transport energization protein TonB [Zunongwangia mangrovi]
MKPKKNPKADLRKKTVLFLQIGLIVVLLFSYVMINLKTYDQKQAKAEQWDPVEMTEEEAIPITKVQEDLPPPKPKDPPVIELIEDESPETEDEMESTETSLDDIVEVDEIIEAPDDDPVEPVPFEFIEDVPIFPGCESLDDNEERKACMSEKISRFITKRFNTGLGEDLGLSGINRVTIMFEIDKNGDVKNVKARGPHKLLEEEGKRVIKLLPTMEPGKQRGKPVPVRYTIPINFKIQN